MTIAYYDENYADFIKNTLNVDMTDLYNPFLNNLSPGSKILDAGCGSGRDSLAFKALGFDVTSFDASQEMASFASKLIGSDVKCLTFNELDYFNYFDAIWACASLLHVPKNQIVNTIKNLAKALKNNGFFYMSFKYGNQERHSPDGRFFLDLNEKLLRELLAEVDNLIIDSIWITDDKRAERYNSKWINVITTKINIDP